MNYEILKNMLYVNLVISIYKVHIFQLTGHFQGARTPIDTIVVYGVGRELEFSWRLRLFGGDSIPLFVQVHCKLQFPNDYWLSLQIARCVRICIRWQLSVEIIYSFATWCKLSQVNEVTTITLWLSL